MLLNP